jgi:hypothetical protein
MHNASSTDGNVDTFRNKMLRPLAKMETFLSKKQHRPARRVEGIYVGWRGLSQTIPPLNFLTFWGRKSAAERVGHGAVVELLSELEGLKTASNHHYQDEIEGRNRMATKLLIIGHSFGGDIVYSATAPILIERMIEHPDGTASPQTPRTMGDLVVLINPAFEAARFETLHRLAATRASHPDRSCVLAVFTSKGDQATKLAFPAGRTLTMLSESHRDAGQVSANRTAVGHYSPYIDFDLQTIEKTQSGNEDDAKSGERVLLLSDQLKSTSGKNDLSIVDRTYRFTHCQLQPRTNHTHVGPVFVVSVDPNIIPDHGTIDRWVFTRFLAEFLQVFSSPEQ